MADEYGEDDWQELLPPSHQPTDNADDSASLWLPMMLLIASINLAVYGPAATVLPPTEMRGVALTLSVACGASGVTLLCWRIRQSSTE